MECPLCHENFTSPKILPCAHLLCRQCLITWLKTESDALCPLCCDVIVDAEQRADKTCEDVADSLPTDLSMEARVECAAILGKDHVCCSCRNTKATSICLDCGDTFCNTCTVFHKNMSISRHHKVEDLATMTPQRLATSRQKACAAHPDKTSELYCPTHGAAICHLCSTSKHRACPEVTELEDKTTEARGVLAELAAMLKAGESKLEWAISELDQYLAFIEKTTEITLADIDKKCDRLQQSVETCRQHLKELMKGANSNAKDAIRDRKTGLSGKCRKMASHYQIVDGTSLALPRAFIVGNLSSLQGRIKDLDTNTILPEGTQVITMAALIIDMATIERMEKELTELGQIMELDHDPLVQQSTIWRFHAHHGDNISLSNDYQTAEKTGLFKGLVLSSEPLKMKMLYEVRVDDGSADIFAWDLCCGATDRDPASLTLPDDVPEGWESAVICSDYVCDNGTEGKNSSGQKLGDLGVGSRVGLLVDAASCLHLFVDGQDQGVVARDLKQPCYAFFEVIEDTIKISTLSLTKVP